MNGYTGEILRVNLTTRKIDVIKTDQYRPWVGGHGMGAAIFFDLVGDKIVEMQNGFHPDNVITIMTSPLTGTLVPACAGRIEMQGVGVQSDPINWFTRSNFGGRFAMMLKHSGWDGIVIEGTADAPVWLDIRDKKVAIRDCDALSLWGQDAWQTQETIWEYVAQGGRFRQWYDPGGVRRHDDAATRRGSDRGRGREPLSHGLRDPRRIERVRAGRFRRGLGCQAAEGDQRHRLGGRARGQCPSPAGGASVAATPIWI